MKEYVLQSGDAADLPGYKEEKQTVVDENQVNEAFEPANDAFSGLRDLGDWVIEFLTELFSGAFGNIL